jgi:hypothetical protein
MKLRITPEDLKRSLIITPDWYPCEIMKVDEHPSKSGDSMNWDVYFTVLSPEQFAGVPIIRTFNEKAPGFAIEFIAACGGNIDPESGGEFELTAAKGKKIEVQVQNEMYNNVLRNKAVSFRPLNG